MAGPAASPVGRQAAGVTYGDLKGQSMDLSSITLATAVLGAVAGMTGAVLGGLNTWVNIRRDRVRLRVRLYEVITMHPDFGGQRTFAIEALNLSEFPVVITGIGLNLTTKATASLLPAKGTEPKGKLPLRLEPRTSYTKLFLASGIDKLWPKMRSTYAYTECGVTAKGRIAVPRNRRGPR